MKKPPLTEEECQKDFAEALQDMGKFINKHGADMATFVSGIAVCRYTDSKETMKKNMEMIWELCEKLDSDDELEEDGDTEA
jgi:hypothetical protein